MRFFLTKTLYLCAAITLTAFAWGIFRHGADILFYLTVLPPPFILLHIPNQNRAATIMQHCLLISPIGIAIGSLLACNAPTGNPDGEVMGLLLLTSAYALLTTPLCVIPLLLKKQPTLPPMNNLNFRQATPFNLPALRLLYNEIIDAMDGAASHAQWKRGGYPTDDFLQTKAALGELWVMEKNAEIIAAMVLNNECNPGYAQAEWLINCSPSEVMAIHTLGVSPRVQGQGIGKAMVQQAIEVARKQGCKCMRLDVIDTNPAAGDFYAAIGFSFRGRYELDYPGAVCTNFDLYELAL